jgi:hypothetical protein
MASGVHRTHSGRRGTRVKKLISCRPDRGTASINCSRVDPWVLEPRLRRPLEAVSARRPHPRPGTPEWPIDWLGDSRRPRCIAGLRPPRPTRRKLAYHLREYTHDLELHPRQPAKCITLPRPRVPINSQLYWYKPNNSLTKYNCYGWAVDESREFWMVGPCAAVYTVIKSRATPRTLM